MSRGAVTLAVVLSGMVVTVLDFAVLNVALPSIRADLAASAAEMQLAVAGYNVTYGALLVAGGRLGDRFGHRRLFVVGTAVFTVASLGCAAAGSGAVLVGFRLLQGVGAALLFPQVLSILTIAFHGADRTRAFGAYAVALGVAWVGGQFLGATFAEFDVLGLGWRMCFLVNLPFCAFALLGARRFVAASRSPETPAIDVPGTALLTVAVGLVIAPLVVGRDAGWPPWAVVALAAAAPVFALFLLQQGRAGRRSGAAPVVEPRLWSAPGFLAGTATVLLQYCGMGSFFLYFAVWVQDGEGLGPWGAALAFLPLGITFVGLSVAGASLVRRLGPVAIPAGAVTVLAGDVALVAVIGHHGDGPVPALTLALPLAAVGAGMALVLVPLISTVLRHLDPALAGSGSGVLSTCQQLGNAVGVAGIGVLFYGGGDLRDGFVAALVATAALAAVVAVLSASLARRAPVSAGRG